MPQVAWIKCTVLFLEEAKGSDADEDEDEDADAEMCTRYTVLTPVLYRTLHYTVPVGTRYSTLRVYV